MARLAWFALPLGMVTGVVSLTASVPRYFVGHFVDTSAVGVFAALACPGMILQQTTMALSQASLPRFGEYFGRADTVAFRRLLFQVVAINGMIGLIGISVSVSMGRHVLAFLYSDEFVSCNDAFVWVTASFALNCLGATGVALTASRRFRTQFAISLLSLATMLVACVLLVPSQGLMGAAFALVVVAAARLVVISWCVARVIRELKFQPAAAPAAAPSVHSVVITSARKSATNQICCRKSQIR
jgi:O-antigen/teichoic acid export membrane protein